MSIKVTRPYLFLFACSLLACRTTNASRVQSDESMTVDSNNASNPLALGVGVDAYTGNSTNYTCVVGTSNVTTGSSSAAPHASSSDHATHDAGLVDSAAPAATDNGMVTVTQVPSLGMAGLRGTIMASDLQTDPTVAGAWSNILDGSAAQSATGLKLDDSTGLSYYLTLYDDSYTAKSTLDASASANFSQLLGGTNVDVSGKFSQVFQSGNQSQYLIIDGVYNGYAEFLTNPAIAPMFGAPLQAIIANQNATTWGPFDHNCGNMYVSGLVHGARFKAVIAMNKNSGQATTSSSLGLQVGAPKLSASLSSVTDFLSTQTVTAMALEVDGGAVVTAATVDDLIHGVSTWATSLQSATTNHQLPAQAAILEPYSIVSFYEATGSSGSAPVMTALPPTLFDDPMAEPRGSTLRLYRNYYTEIQADIARLADAGSDYHDQLTTAQQYLASLVQKAHSCVSIATDCTEMAAPSSLNLNLPPLQDNTPAPPPAQNVAAVTSFDVQYNLFRQASTSVYSDSLCSPVAGGYHLATADQLNYLVQHNEVLYSGYSLVQWIPSGGIWTSDADDSQQTIFSVDGARNGGDIAFSVTPTHWYNLFENFYYVVCVLP